MQTHHFNVLQGHEFMNLTTFRKSGQAMVTPVWFAQEGSTLYLLTIKDAGKIKRIRNNGRVLVGPCDRSGKPLGPSVEGQARVLSGADRDRADHLLNRKYGLIKRVFDLGLRVFGRGPSKRDFVAIEPA